MNCPLADLRLPEADAWRQLRQSRSRVRIGELELKWISPAPDGVTRLGVSVRKKNGSAPLRNRLRRQLRELVRIKKEELGSVWLLWSFPPRRVATHTSVVREQAIQMLSQAGLIRS